MSDDNAALAASNKPPRLADDLLWGCSAIADEIGLTDRKCFYQLEGGRIPAKKVGAVWVASRQKLRQHLIGE